MNILSDLAITVSSLAAGTNKRSTNTHRSFVQWGRWSGMSTQFGSGKSRIEVRSRLNERFVL